MPQWVMENGIPSCLRKENWFMIAAGYQQIRWPIYATQAGAKAMWCSHDLKFRGIPSIPVNPCSIQQSRTIYSLPTYIAINFCCMCLCMRANHDQVNVFFIKLAMHFS